MSARTKGEAPITLAEARQRAQIWFDRQVEIISQAHGRSWPEHREWIEAYLRQEIRERLIARGWRPTDVQH